MSTVWIFVSVMVHLPHKWNSHSPADIFIARVEVKLAFRLVPLTLMRETVSGSRFKIIGGVALATYGVV